MARKAKIEKLKRQQRTVAHYAAQRQALKRAGDYQGLAQLPRDASPVRLRHRDQIDGRPRGYMRKFKLSRIRFRELAHAGQLPGVRKASW